MKDKVNQMFKDKLFLVMMVIGLLTAVAAVGVLTVSNTDEKGQSPYLEVPGGEIIAQDSVPETAQKEEKAEEKILRHQTIANFLEKVLQVEPEKVDFSATKIEYAMPCDVLEKFVQFLTFMEKCSCKEPKWVKSFKYYSQNGQMQDKCQNCRANINNFDNSSCCSSCVK